MKQVLQTEWTWYASLKVPGRIWVVSVDQFGDSYQFIWQCPEKRWGLKVLGFYQHKETKIIIDC